MPGKQQPKSVADIARELWELTQAYAKQETVDPLKKLGRYLGFGLAGSLFVSLGAGLLALGVLRALQTVDWFERPWSFVPYLVVLLGLGVTIGLIARSIAASFAPAPGGSAEPPVPGAATTVIDSTGEVR